MRPVQKKGGVALADEALGRSRGGFTTKVHLAFEGKGRVLGIVVTEGQRNDCTQLEAVLATVRVRRKRGRPRQRPQRLILDRGYSFPHCRQLLRRRHIAHVIPERKDQIAQRRQRGSRGGRPPLFDRALYALRNWAERGVNRLKQWRRVATRYEKRAAYYLAFIQFVAVIGWLRDLSDTP
jgi:transposase